MKNIPWKRIFVGCALFAALVLARCIATVVRTVYYGGRDPLNALAADPWTYLGLAAVLLGAAAYLCRAGKKEE